MDQEVETAVHAFLNRKSIDQASSSNPSRYLVWLESDEDSMRILKRYLTSEHWITDWIYSGQVPEDASEDARSYRATFGETVPPSDLRSVRRFNTDLRVIYRRIARTVSESNAERIDVSGTLSKASTVAWVAFLTPAAIAVYGYLYTSVYFGNFGIDTALFFSTGDYIAHSINRIKILAFLLAGSAFGVLSVIREETTVPGVLRRIQSRRRLRHMYFMVIVFTLASIVHFWTSPHMFFLSLMFLILTLGLGHRICFAITDRYFTGTPLLGWFFGLLLTCGLVVWCYAKSQAHAVAELAPNSFLVETGGRTFSEANYKMIGTSSSYTFLVSNGGNVEVVPNRTLRRVVLSAPRDGVVTKLRLWIAEGFRRAVDPSEAGNQNSDP